MTVLIVGASLGGLRVAEALRKQGYTGGITVLGDEPELPYNRPPLSKEVLTGEAVPDVAFPMKDSVADVSWQLGDAAISLEVKDQTVVTKSGRKHDYSKLIIATGIRPRPISVDPHGLGGIHYLRTLSDAIELRAALRPGQRVVILGSGFIACEVAAAAAKAGCQTTVATRSRIPMERALGPRLGEAMRTRHERHGVNFMTGVQAFGLVGDVSVEEIILDSGVMLPCDLLVVATGSLPNTEWLAGSGLDLTDGVLCNGAMQALDENGEVVPDIFAIGDVARYPNPLFDDIPRRVEHWNLPTETAKRAAEVVAAQLTDAGPEALKELIAKPFAPLPSFWSDQYDAQLLSFGLPYLADRSELVAGDPLDSCIFEYFRGDRFVGVCGIGMRSAVQGYRGRFAPQP